MVKTDEIEVSGFYRVIKTSPGLFKHKSSTCLFAFLTTKHSANSTGYKLNWALLLTAKVIKYWKIDAKPFPDEAETQHQLYRPVGIRRPSPHDSALHE
jgi:hypothetical protein